MGIPTPTPTPPRLLIIFLLFLTELHTYQARLKHTMLPGHPENSPVRIPEAGITDVYHNALAWEFRNRKKNP